MKFGDLKVGDVFVLEGNTLIKTDPIQYELANSDGEINTEEGNCVYFIVPKPCDLIYAGAPDFIWDEAVVGDILEEV